VALWERHVGSLTEFLARAGHRDEAARLGIAKRLEHARAELERVGGADYLTSLVGTIGADPVHRLVREGRIDGRGSPAKTGRVSGRGDAVRA
jgi:hypothetical protein